jgi:hypothetical protein
MHLKKQELKQKLKLEKEQMVKIKITQKRKLMRLTK